MESTGQRMRGLSGFRIIRHTVFRSEVPTVPSNLSLDRWPEALARDPLINPRNLKKFGKDLPWDKDGKIEVIFAGPERRVMTTHQLKIFERLYQGDGEHRPADLTLIYASARKVLIRHRQIARIVCLSDSISIPGVSLRKIPVITRIKRPSHTKGNAVEYVFDALWEDQIWDQGTYFAFIRNTLRPRPKRP
jgi:hypothetical protein